jgi:hypothetical protein
LAKTGRARLEGILSDLWNSFGKRTRVGPI